MAKSVIEQLQELDQQRSTLLEQAKSDALERAQAAIAELNELGFSYFLGSSEAPQKRARKATRSARHRPSDRPCPICGYRTDPPHDGRSHRNQQKKRPFTDQELESWGMTRV